MRATHPDLDVFEARSSKAVTLRMASVVAQLSVAAPCAFRSCDRHRDFRSGSALGRLAFSDGPAELALVGGYRGFTATKSASINNVSLRLRRLNCSLVRS